jgi:hypothetical protein
VASPTARSTPVIDGAGQEAVEKCLGTARDALEGLEKIEALWGSPRIFPQLPFLLLSSR